MPVTYFGTDIAGSVCMARLAGASIGTPLEGSTEPRVAESRLYERLGVVFHPRDLKGPLVEDAAT